MARLELSRVSKRYGAVAAVDDVSIGSIGRLYDATVMARPGGRGSRMTAFKLKSAPVALSSTTTFPQGLAQAAT